jgi:hypothetical protein
VKFQKFPGILLGVIKINPPIGGDALESVTVELEEYRDLKKILNN